MTARTITTAAALVAGIAAALPHPVRAAVPEYSFTVVKTYPHDPAAFTEGLLFQNGFLYESTGLEGRSSIRREKLETGKVLQEYDLDPKYFGEGIVIWNAKLIGLTYTTQIGFVYDAETFKPLSDFHYKGEGWALTKDDTRLYMSDGTSDLRILNPETLDQIGSIHVTCDGRPVQNINELEWVKGEIFANIWKIPLIARIDPKTGAVTGLIDGSRLFALAASKGRTIDVLNGIAYDAAADRLFVTGKLWPKLFQIRLSRRPGGKDLCSTIPDR
nr:glutaminyl-peptide cyclotransferase [uncultured Rhodopila sp.]